jgi:AraC family transcriptional regulator
MNVKLIDRKPTTVAYLRHVGPYGPDLSRFWQETVHPWMETTTCWSGRVTESA